MIQDQSDSVYKYIEMPKVFHQRANDVLLHTKYSARVCERLVTFLAKERPKTPLELERVEYLKDFVLKTAQNNEATILLLDYIKEFLEAMAKDAELLTESAKTKDQLRDQSDTIGVLNGRIELLTNLLKNEVSSGITKTA